MSFRPSIHGWPFANRFQTDAASVGLGAMPSSGLGLGGGMCLTALDRYLGGIGVPRDVEAPEPGSPLHEEIRRRQVVAVDGLWTRLRQVQGAPDGSWRDAIPVPLPLNGGDAAGTTRAAWRRARKAIASGEPTLLTLLPHGNGYTRGQAATQVLAYAWHREGARVTLSIYDPAHPGDDDQRLGFSLRGELDARLSGGRRIRAFLHHDYDRGRTGGLRGETFADRGVIGLNRKVHGLLAVLPGRRLELFARDAEGSLLHFYRDPRKPWEGVNVTERDELHAAQLYSDPTAVRSAGTLHVFSRTYVGDLLHFRLLRSWSVANRTDQRRAGPRFRLEGQPVAVAGGRAALHVFGRGADGALVHYETSPLRPWLARDIGIQAPIAGDPTAVRIGDDVHAVARTRQGHMLHVGPSANGLTSVDVTALLGSNTVQLASRPVLLVHEDRLHVAGRTPDGDLVHAVRTPEGRWLGSRPGTRIQGDPVLVAGPAGVHLMALGEEGAVIHGWRERDAWRLETLLDRAPGGEVSTLVGWGGAAELGALLRTTEEAWLMRWREDSGWTMAPARALAGVAPKQVPEERLVAAVDRAGGPHVFATDRQGTVVHLETSSWAEPKSTSANGWTGEAWRCPLPLETAAAVIVSSPEQPARAADRPTTTRAGKRNGKPAATGAAIGNGAAGKANGKRNGKDGEAGNKADRKAARRAEKKAAKARKAEKKAKKQATVAKSPNRLKRRGGLRPPPEVEGMAELPYLPWPEDEPGSEPVTPESAQESLGEAPDAALFDLPDGLDDDPVVEFVDDADDDRAPDPTVGAGDGIEDDEAAGAGDDLEDDEAFDAWLRSTAGPLAGERAEPAAPEAERGFDPELDLDPEPEEEWEPQFDADEEDGDAAEPEAEAVDVEPLAGLELDVVDQEDDEDEDDPLDGLPLMDWPEDEPPRAKGAKGEGAKGEYRWEKESPLSETAADGDKPKKAPAAPASKGKKGKRRK